MRLLPLHLIFILVLITPLNVSGADALSPEDQLELDHLLGVLDKHTEIATFTKMNADYIPGMVTVLEGREMEALGKHNVMEALTLVPGLDISLSVGGVPSMTSRGIGGPYLPATALIMLNGVSMNNTSSGNGSMIFGIPMGQIERIEVIRGPGTSINGEFAYNSVINIITRNDGNTLFGSYGRFETSQAGAIATYNDPEKQLKLSLNLANSGTDGVEHTYGPDYFGQYGKSDEARDIDSYFANFQYHNFSITSTHLNAGPGEFFQTFPHDNHLHNSQQTDKLIEAKQLLQPVSGLNMSFQLGWKNNRADIHHTRIAPPGFTSIPLGITYPDGINLGFYSEEEKFFSSLETTWKATPKNTVTSALNFNHTRIKDIYLMRDVDPATLQPVPWDKYTGADNFMDENAKREHYAVALQDEHHFSEHFTIMAGLRYDHYSDVEDDQITPKISGIWQPSECHIYKLQYARAFRPPTFLELTGNTNFIQGNDKINSEIIDTYEVGYIYRANTIIAKITLFYSDLEDLITTETNNAGTGLTYTNNSSATQTGFELEYKQDLLSNLKFDGNLSYATTHDDETHEEVVNARNWLMNLGLTYSPVAWASINTQYRYVDQRYRDETDPRRDLQSYDTLDLTLSFYPQIISGLTLRTGLKNIFDAQAYVASNERTAFTTHQAADYPVLDRTWWIQATYDF